MNNDFAKESRLRRWLRSKIKAKEKMNAFSWVVFAFLTLLTLTFIIVYFWGIMTSFKSILEFDTVGNIVGLPDQWSLENFIFVFSNFRIKLSGKTFYLENMILNSVLYAVGCAFIQTAVQCVVAYLAAKFRFKFSGLIYWVVVITMTIPVVGTDISTIQILQNIGLYDSMIGMFVLKFNFLGAYFLVFYATFRSLPDDYAGAAYVDGAGEFGILIHVILPMVANMFFTIFLLNMITYWNDYRTPLLYMPNNPTLSYGIQWLSTSSLQEFSHTTVRLASCIIMVIPIIVVFIVFKNRIMDKVSLGGIKE